MPRPPINLATLTGKPSWLNLAGRIDRSACVEVSAADFWRRTPLRPARTFARAGARALKRGKPNAKTHREAKGTFILTAGELEALLARRPPRRLSGDWRTAKANAMKRAHDAAGRPLPRRDPAHGGKQKQFTLDHNLEANPNAGASRTKILGLTEAGPLQGGLPRTPQAPGSQTRVPGSPGSSGSPGSPGSPGCSSSHADPPAHPPQVAGYMAAGGWSQTLTLERWRQHARLAQHFLICPCCRQKTVKLFMPLCTPDEWRDARLAQQWLDWRQRDEGTRGPRDEGIQGPRDEGTRGPRDEGIQGPRDRGIQGPRDEGIQGPRDERTQGPRNEGLEAVLLARYGILFAPRRLICRQCLGLRYGTGMRHRRANTWNLYTARARVQAVQRWYQRNLAIQGRYRRKIAALQSAPRNVPPI